MTRVPLPRGVWTTTISDPNAFIPMVTKRCSPSAASSSTVSASGSFSTPSPSDSDTPCFLKFAASFFGSKSADTRALYARDTYRSTLHWRAGLSANVPVLPHRIERAAAKRSLGSGFMRVLGSILAMPPMHSEECRAMISEISAEPEERRAAVAPNRTERKRRGSRGDRRMHVPCRTSFPVEPS